MTIRYYIQKKAKSGYDRYFDLAIESSKARAIKEAKREAEKCHRKVRVKTWKGKIIFET